MHSTRNARVNGGGAKLEAEELPHHCQPWKWQADKEMWWQWAEMAWGLLALAISK